MAESTEAVVAEPVIAQPFEEPPPGQEIALPDSRGVISAFSNENNFKAAQRMAKALMQATLVPKAYRESLPNTLIAMELADRIGASVFMVMQNLDVINGVPGWRAKFLIATVNTCGRFSALKFIWKGEEGKPGWECRAVAKELKTGEECIGPKVTMEIAAAEGWSSKAGSKWKTIPELMMMYRAGAFWTRVYAPELSLGMLTAEEITDILPEERPPMIAAGGPVTDVVSNAAANLLQKIKPETEPASVETEPPSQGIPLQDTKYRNIASEPSGEPPVVETKTEEKEEKRRGRPKACKMQFCKGTLKTQAEIDSGYCDEKGHREYMTKLQREAQGTAPPPRGSEPLAGRTGSSKGIVDVEVVDPNEADNSALLQLIGRLKHKLMTEEQGVVAEVSIRLNSIMEGRCDDFDDLPTFLHDFPKYIPNISKAADGK